MTRCCRRNLRSTSFTVDMMRPVCAAMSRAASGPASSTTSTLLGAVPIATWESAEAALKGTARACVLAWDSYRGGCSEPSTGGSPACSWAATSAALPSMSPDAAARSSAVSVLAATASRSVAASWLRRIPLIQSRSPMRSNRAGLPKREQRQQTRADSRGYQDAPETHQLPHVAPGEHPETPRIRLFLRPGSLSYDLLRSPNVLWEQGVAGSNPAVPTIADADGGTLRGRDKLLG